MRDWARYKKAGDLRKEGLTYKKIGEALGVGQARAHQMVATQEWKERRESWRDEDLREAMDEQENQG